MDCGSSVADYFVVAGLPENPVVSSKDYCESLTPAQRKIEPITDITVIFPTLGEDVPRGFECVEKTPTGVSANLNSGSIRTPDCFLCFRRGRDKPPLVDVGVMYQEKEMLVADAEVVISTPTGKPANVNNTSARTLLTYRRASENMACNDLIVTDICVINRNRGESPPHAFCMIDRNLNLGLVGCDVFICYKKSMNRPVLLSYEPEVLFRYPLINKQGFPFPSNAAEFCLPMGASIEVWPKKSVRPRPVFSTFVLTVGDAVEKIYGAAVVFYEKFDEEKLTAEQRQELTYNVGNQHESVHVNKCICLLSHHPFFEAYRIFLLYLELMSRTGPHEIPIERFISHLLEEVPFPSPQRPHILLELSAAQNILLSQPHDSLLPKSGASFMYLLLSLQPDDCLMILLLLLTEQKILIHSLQPDVLTSVAEALSVIIFPFHWQCPYIPLCPLKLSVVLQAPVPFLVGVDSRFFDLYELPTEVTCVDLDTTSITVSEDKRNFLNLKLLPKKPARTLKNTLKELKMKLKILQSDSEMETADRRRASNVVDIDLKFKKREKLLELEIQEAFLRFMTSLLKGYRSHLQPITKAPKKGATDASSLFDFEGFLKSRDRSFHKFFNMMLKTQMFTRFIEERSFVSDMDSSLVFFDECIENIDKMRSGSIAEPVRLLDTNELYQNEMIAFVTPPDTAGLPENATYSYKSKFNLQTSLFSSKHKGMRSNDVSRVSRTGYDISTPGSPVARRTKQEIRSAQKTAKRYVENPQQWPVYLLSTVYSLWFIHLPSYVSITSSKHMALCIAYEMLTRISKIRLRPADEVCYRIVMQLCGIYSQPLIALKVLFEMKKCGLTPNAITYGFYNKAVLEAEWPSNVSNSSQLMWNKLRNVILGVAQFKTAGKSRMSHSADEVDQVSMGSGGSSDSQCPSKLLKNKILTSERGSFDEASPGLSKLPEEGDKESDAATRISSSSDIGYGSMSGEVTKNNAEAEETKGNGNLFGKMGQSFDQWMRNGVDSLANMANFKGEMGYYSPAGLIMPGDKSEYSNNEESRYPQKSKASKKLDFEKAAASKTSEEKTEDAVGLLRSVSFGNDTQIMSKLQEIKRIKPMEEQTINEVEDMKPPIGKKRECSVDSTMSLENKVNEFYEGSRSGSVEKDSSKSSSNSRELTPVDESQLTIQATQQPRSPSMNILTRGSQLSSPVRTPVTQNDPLGALSDPNSPVVNHDQGKLTQSLISRGSPQRTCSEGHIGASIEGMRTSSEEMRDKMLMRPPESPATSFHRSSTLPNYATQFETSEENDGLSEDKAFTPSATRSSSSNIVSGISSFGAGFKNPFGRNSPARMSLRKAGTQFIESAFGGKKAEALMEGLSQFKSVASVTVKKIDEWRDFVGTNANSNYTRNVPFGMNSQEDLDEEDGDIPGTDQWASVSESYLDQLLPSTEPGSARGSFALPDIGYMLNVETPLSGSTQSLVAPDRYGSDFNRRDSVRHIAIDVNMSSCSLCHGCSNLMFDEEIMAGWTADDSNLNTKCPHCKKCEVPILEICLKDYRHYDLSKYVGSYSKSDGASNQGSLSRKSSMRKNSPRGPSSPPSKMQEEKELKEKSGAFKEERKKDEEECDPLRNIDPAELDPLGVIEDEIRERSRRNSPEPEEMSRKSSVISQPENEDRGNPNFGNTLMVPTNEVAKEPQEHTVVMSPAVCSPIIVPYLCPLVLRKELENILEREGGGSLAQAEFVDEHPIIYWNLVWFFHRASFPSHIRGLCLYSSTTLPSKITITEQDGSEKTEAFKVHSSWEGADHRNVSIKCFWDNPKFHEQFSEPLYKIWQKNQKLKEEASTSSSGGNSPSSPEANSVNKMMSNLLKGVQGNTLLQFCPQLMFHYSKQPNPKHYSAYRDILFLALVAAGRDSVEAYGFYGYDREYRQVYEKLCSNDDHESMGLADMPPSDKALYCRRYFRDLIL